MLSPSIKLDLMMANLRSAQGDENMAHSRSDIKSLAWKFANEPHVGLDNDDHDTDVTFDSDAAAESDDSDGMFHGLFYLGSKVLTEVEMQSPVEERKIIATTIRTPRRSNNSSQASSTRELDSFSSQVCFDNSESCSSSEAIAVVSPCQGPTQSTPSPCCKEAQSTMMCLSPSHEQTDDISNVSLFEGSLAKQDRKSLLGEFAPLYKHKGQDCRSDDGIARLPLLKESDRILGERNLQPSLGPSPNGKPFSQSRRLWNDRKCQARVGDSSSECRTVNSSRKHAVGKYAVVPEGLQNETRVGSLPDGSKSNISSRGKWKEYDGRRQARSLTDEDFNELRGCIDLGFVFSQDHIPDLCETLPALEICYAIAHGPISTVCNMESSVSVSTGSTPISPWKVVSPGDQPQQVKARLRHWAQAVACNVWQAR